MPSHRSLRMAEAIREVVATAILFDVADPRVRAVTVLRVEVSPDLRQARIFVSIMGTETERKKALQGLTHATGFLQARVAARLQTRFTPVLGFKLDDSVKKSVELGRLIEEAVASDRKDGASSLPDEPQPARRCRTSTTARSPTRRRPEHPTVGAIPAGPVRSEAGRSGGTPAHDHPRDPTPMPARGPRRLPIRRDPVREPNERID